MKNIDFTGVALAIAFAWAISSIASCTKETEKERIQSITRIELVKAAAGIKENHENP